MKKTNNITWKLIMVLVVFPAIFYSACDDDDTVDSLPPVIEMIRTTTPDESDVAIDRGGLGQTIIIVGKNFMNLQEIYINDLKTSFLPTFVTNTHIVVTIDEDTPTFATHDNVPDIIRIVNPAGEATKEFVILPPPPVIATISNEFAKAGETLTITGQYFFFVEGVEFPGGIISTTVSANPNGRSMTVVVPEGISESGFISVTTESGSKSSAPAWRFNDRTGMIADMDEINPFAPWGPQPELGSSDPASIDGNYIRVSGINIPAPMWWNNDQVIPMETIVWPILDGDPSDYVIKFEMNTAEMWKSGWFEVNLGWTYFYRFMPWNTPPSATQYWSVGTRTDFNTNGWQTIVIPMNKFRLKPGNDPDGNIISSLKELEGKGVVMAFQNPDSPGGLAISNLHLCFDNFRLVKIN